MTLESIEKLRKLAADINAREIVDHMELYPSCVFDGHWLDAWHREFDRLLEDIQAEVDERYMLLPVDAEGVPIHYGDMLKLKDTPDREASNGWYITIGHAGVMLDGDGWELPPSDFVHVKPRTVEDVLTDALVEYDETDRLTPGEIVAKYASELRMAVE